MQAHDPSSRPTNDAELAAGTHNRVFAVVCAIAFVGTAAVNLAVDPFRVYHDAWSRPYPHAGRRYLVPGLVRNVSYDYDAVTLGTSHSANFQPEQMERELGWKTLRGTLSGSTISEQLMVLRTTLDAGRAKHVLWGIDYCYAQEPLDQALTSGKMPVYLYERTWRTPFLYLVSSATLADSFRVMRGKGERLSENGIWFPEQTRKIAKDQALKAFPGWLRHQHEMKRRPAPELQDQNVAEIARIIRDNPQVEFVCILPPVSVLQSIPEHEHGAENFTERLRFRHDLFEALTALPNCRLHDFEQADRVTRDLAQFIDPTHYGQDINDWIIREIRADHYRVTRDSIPALQSHFRGYTHDFLTQTTQPGNPLGERLGLAKLDLAKSRLRVAREVGSDGPVRR